jgi:hypothetical protein
MLLSSVAPNPDRNLQIILAYNSGVVCVETAIVVPAAGKILNLLPEKTASR